MDPPPSLSSGLYKTTHHFFWKKLYNNVVKSRAEIITKETYWQVKERVRAVRVRQMERDCLKYIFLRYSTRENLNSLYIIKQIHKYFKLILYLFHGIEWKSLLPLYLRWSFDWIGVISTLILKLRSPGLLQYTLANFSKLPTSRCQYEFDTSLPSVTSNKTFLD